MLLMHLLPSMRLMCAVLYMQAFNSKAHRLEGTGATAVTSTASQRQPPGRSTAGRRQQQQQQQQGSSFDSRPAVSAAQANKSKWQMQSQQLRAAMRAARPQQAGAGAAAGGGWGAAAQAAEVEDTRWVIRVIVVIAGLPTHRAKCANAMASALVPTDLPREQHKRLGGLLVQLLMAGCVVQRMLRFVRCWRTEGSKRLHACTIRSP